VAPSDSNGEMRRPLRGLATYAAVGCAVAASAAAVGWARTARPLADQGPSIRIVDVRPLRSPDTSLRDLITHTFAVRVATGGWTLLPYQPAVPASDNRRRAGHWRLYLDGHPLGENLGDEHVSYVYVPPGTHWLAAELSKADSTSLDPAVWSEPVVLHVPRVIRCWQTGWRGTPETGTPTFTCSRWARLEPLRVVEAISSRKEEA